MSDHVSDEKKLQKPQDNLFVFNDKNLCRFHKRKWAFDMVEVCTKNPRPQRYWCHFTIRLFDNEEFVQCYPKRGQLNFTSTTDEKEHFSQRTR